MDHYQHRNGSFQANPIQNPVDVEEPYGPIASFITVYNDLFDHNDAIMHASAKKKTPWMEDMYFAMKIAQQKLSKDYAEVTPMMGMLLISAHIIDLFHKLWSFRKWGKGMNINPEDETSYTTQYQEAFLKCVENEYSAKYTRVPVIKAERIPSKTLFPTVMASGSGKSSFDLYDLSRDDEEYRKPNNVDETTPWGSNRAAPSLNAPRLHMHSLPESLKNWGQVDWNINDDHSEQMEIHSTIGIPDITDWWRQQLETHSKYTNLSNVAGDIFPIIPHGVGPQARLSLGLVVIGWRQCNITGRTLRGNVILREFAQVNNGILVGDDQGFDTMNTENDSEIQTLAEQRQLLRVAKVHDLLAMWQDTYNLHATHKESCAPNKQITALWYISDTKEIVKASRSLFQHDGMAAFKLSERSPLPPALSVKDLLGGLTEILIVHRIRRIDCHPVKYVEDSAPESISGTKTWLDSNGDLDDPNDSEDDSAADVEYGIKWDNGIEDLESPEQWDVRAWRNIPGLICPTPKSKRHAQMVLVTVNSMETRTNKVNKKK